MILASLLNLTPTALSCWLQHRWEPVRTYAAWTQIIDDEARENPIYNPEKSNAKAYACISSRSAWLGSDNTAGNSGSNDAPRNRYDWFTDDAVWRCLRKNSKTEKCLTEFLDLEPASTNRIITEEENNNEQNFKKDFIEFMEDANVLLLWLMAANDSKDSWRGRRIFLYAGYAAVNGVLSLSDSLDSAGIRLNQLQ